MNRWQRGGHYVASVVGAAVSVLCLWAVFVTVEGEFPVWVPLVFAVGNAGFATYHWRQARI